MEKKKLKAFSIAKYTYHEALMASQLQSSGAQQSRLLEKYKKNNKSVRNQALGMKLGFGVALAILPLIPLIGYNELFSAMNTISIARETIFFISNFVMGIYFLMALLYILMIGLFPTGSLMTGEAFKMLQILPIKKNELKKIAVMSLFRNVDVALILMMFGFPVVLLIVTQSIVAFFLCLMSSILNSLFGFCIVIILGRKISNIFSNEAKSGKRANMIRIGTLVGYMILIFGTSFMIQWAISLIFYFLEVFSVNPPPMILNIILSILPLPITQGYIISLGIYTSHFSLELMISSIIGIILFALVVWGLYKGAIQSLHEVTMTELKVKRKKSEISEKKEEIQVEIISKTPIKSYLDKDIKSASHDMQTFIFLLMPIIYPIIMIVSFQGLTAEISAYPIFGIIIWMIMLGVLLFSPLMLVVGLLNMEESGSSIMASLPIIPREQAKAKLLLMMGIMMISIIILSIMFTLLANSVILFLLLICSLPFGLSFLLLAFEMKVHLFGKLKYKYILEELHKENKILKWLLIILGEIGLYFIIIWLGFMSFFHFGILGTIITELVIGVSSLVILSYIFNKMFPKREKIQYHETGGFLRNHPIIASIVMTILYVIFLYIALLISQLLLILFSLVIPLNLTGAIIVQFFVQFTFMILLWFLIIPFGFKLPTPQKTFNEYSKKIKLTTINPVLRNILIGIVSFGIFSIIVFIGAISLGNYIFYPDVLFGNPTIWYYGWTTFLIMLIPGIWEEIAFRGVMIPVLFKKYEKNRTIIISSIIFGLAHLNNLLSSFLLGVISIENVFEVFCQVIYTIFLGCAFAYMYIKTNSLLPCIILHYLINSVGQLFLTVSFTNYFSAGIFLIGFIGIIPSILIILFVKLTKHFSSKNKILVNI